MKGLKWPLLTLPFPNLVAPEQAFTLACTWRGTETPGTLCAPELDIVLSGGN